MPESAAVIVLPGTEPGGVTTWAGIVEGAVPGSVTCVIDADHAAATCAIDAAARRVLRRRARAVLLPQLSGHAYAAACAAAQRVTRDEPGRVLVAGWMHTDIRFDVELLRRFAPALAGVGAVSHAAASALAASVGDAARDAGAGGAAAACPGATVLPTGVATPRSGPAPLGVPSADAPLRLCYLGRMDRDAKRVLALVHAVVHLHELGVPCTLEAFGDGPDAAAFDRHAAEAAGALGGSAPEAAGSPAGPIVRHDFAPLEAIAPIVAAADLHLLPSRSEGLGLARIEAALLGTASVVCRDAGGALEGLDDGATGLVAHASRDDDEAAVGRAIARAIVDAVPRASVPAAGRADATAVGAPVDPMTARARFAELGAAARDACRMHFDPDRFASRLQTFLDGLAPNPAHAAAWRRIASDPAAHAAFTVPPDAAARTALALAGVAGGAPASSPAGTAHDAAGVVVYGGGAHLRAAWPAFALAGVPVRAIVDDDPARSGTTFAGVPVLSRAGALALAPGDLLLCSWLHEDALARRSCAFAAAGWRVHRIYGRTVAGAASSAHAVDPAGTDTASNGRASVTSART